jgi:hypothetical protein
LNSTDVFGVKIDDPKDFDCSLPKEFSLKYNKNNTDAFKKRKKDYYMFYQHIHKAGGTAFCIQAHHNLPDLRHCSNEALNHLGTPPWNKAEAIEKLGRSFPFISNEFDVFYSYFLEYPHATFATTLRDPVERWFSHYNYEHVNGMDRQNERKSFLSWLRFYSKFTGYNFLLHTFEGTVGVDIDKQEEAVRLFKKYNYVTFHKDENFEEHLHSQWWTFEKYAQKSVTWE